MNYADIQEAWGSPENRPDPAEMNARKQALLAVLRRRRKGRARFLAIVFGALAAITAVFALEQISPDPGGAVDFSREWSILLLFALPWMAWLFMLRLHRRGALGADLGERPIQASLQASLDESRAEQRSDYLVIGLLALSAAVLPLVVWQLQTVGKAGPEIQLPAFIIYPCYVVGVIAWMLYRHRRQLLPRRRHLQALLSSYRRDEA